jgi:hypothetical protein
MAMPSTGTKTKTTFIVLNQFFMFILHTILLAAAANAVNLELVEDYAVVCGINQLGQMVLPSCPEARYSVPCGVQGLPYVGELGRAGGRFDFTFPEPITAYVVATNSILEPVPQALATLASTEPKYVSSTVISTTPNGFGGNINTYLFSFSDGSVHKFSANAIVILPPVGTLLSTVDAFGFVAI